jgi:hypothetical protein
MHFGTKSTLDKKLKNEIHRPQEDPLYVDDLSLGFKLSSVTYKTTQHKGPSSVGL